MNYPDAIWTPGPPSKQGYAGAAVNAVQGVVCHSMVGSYQAAVGELYKLERRASWHFSVLQSGEVHQHYDTLAVTWHCGSIQWNSRLIGIEHEGGLNPYDEPLTPAQRDASVKLVRWLSQQHGFAMSRPGNLHEHNEIAPPNDATACPSHRIPWEFYTEKEEDMAAVQLIWNPDFGRLYVLGQGDPRWIADAAAAADLQRAYGAPTVALSWATLQALGAK